MGIRKNFFAPLASGLGATRRAAMTLLVMMLTATTAWATTTSTINVGGTDYALFTGFTATGGNGTNYANLVDGNTSSDWNATKNFDDPNAPANDFAGGTDDPAFVEFHAEKPFIPKGYVLTCDHENAGFWKPVEWALKAKLNEGDAWTTIHSSTTTLGTGKTFNIDCTNTGDNPYQYFRFEVYEVGTTMKVDLDELQFYGKLCLVQAREATCTEYGLSAACYGGFGDKYYSDDCAKTELTVGNGLIDKIPHTGVHHEASDSNIEYWQCSMCHKYFSDSGCTTEITEAETHSTVFGALSGGCYTLTSQTYTLTADVNTDGYIYIPTGVTATIDLAGHTIDRGLTSAVANGYVIKVAGTLTLTDSSTGGTVKGGMHDEYTSCVYVPNGGTFTLAGGTLIGNTSNVGNRAVYVAFSAHFIMTGGKITGDVCGIDASGHLTISGGEISGNSQRGIYPREYSISISGNPRITDNGNVNVGLYFDDAARLTVTGALTEEASIGITPHGTPTANAPVTVTNGYGTYNTAPPDTYFTLDNNSFVLGWNEDRTEVAVGTELYTVGFDMNGHGTAIDAVSVLSGCKVLEPTVPTADDWYFVGWYTDAACTAGNEWNFDDAVTSNKTLHAKWTQTAIHSITLPEKMVIVSADQEAVGGKYPVGTNIRFKVKSADYVVNGDVSDGTNTLTPDGDGIYTVTMGDADITITATIKKAVEPNKTLSGSENYEAQDGDVLTGSTSGTLTIPDGAKVTLSDVTISGGIVCAGTAEITLVGTNSVSNTWYSSAGIQIGGSGTTLTIKGNGSLNATGGSASAGIGLGRTFGANSTGGRVIIEGGTVTASGGNGIGTGTVGNNMTATIGDIVIKGGTVNARLGKGEIVGVATANIGAIKIYDTIEKVDASKITESVTYMHDDTDVTASASTYFTIIEDGDRRIIVPKDDSDYTITIANGIEYGTLTGAATAKYMEKVTITATPALGYRFSRLVVKDAQNNDVESTGNSFFMPKSDVTVSAVFEQGVHGTTEFAWGYFGPSGFVREASIYDGLTTVNLQQGQSYQILKYDNEYSYRKFLLDNNTYNADIPYAGGTGSFVQNGTSFNNDGDAGFYDITMTDVGNGKWSVSILKTVGQMDVVPDQTYTGSAITPEPLVLAGSLSLTKGTDYVYSYTNNTNVGTAKVRATFQGDYASLGYVEKTFTIAPRTYTVSFDANGGTGTMEPMQLTYDGDWAMLPACTYTTPDGKAFKNWNTAADGTGTDYSDEELVRNLTDEANGNVVLYAQWGKDIATCEIRGTLEAYDDGYGPYNQLAANVEVWDCDTQLTPDTDYSIELDPDVDIYSYEVGKQYQATVTGMGDWGGTKTFTFTFVALHHTVVFDANGGSGTMAGGTVANDGGYAGRYTLPVCGFTAPDGKVFDHWVVDYAGIEENPIKQPGDYFTAPYIFDVSDVQTITVTAYWRDALILLDDDSNQPVGSKNADIIAANNGTTDLTVQLQGRTLYKDGAWNTLCLPFDVTIANSPLAGDGVDVRTLDNTDFSNGTLTLDFTDKDAVTTLKAGKPYLVRWDKPDNYVAYDGTNAAECSDLVSPIFNGVTVSTATANVETDCVDFIGTLSPTVLYEDGAEKTNLYMGAANKLYYPTVEGFKLNACRGYFKLKGVVVNGNGNDNGNENAVRSFDINFGDDATGIVEMRDEKGEMRNGYGYEDGGWYTVDGRRLDGKPAQKGLYIHGGRKVVIK